MDAAEQALMEELGGNRNSKANPTRPPSMRGSKSQRAAAAEERRFWRQLDPYGYVHWK
jgi:hypothetical protein